MVKNVSSRLLSQGVTYRIIFVPHTEADIHKKKTVRQIKNSFRLRPADSPVPELRIRIRDPVSY
jgi:hypothetical protein